MATAYRRLLSSADAPQYAATVNEHYSPTTLATLLVRGDVELRRASAMALGLLGNSRSIEPLGRALNDPDRGVRLVADDSFRGLLLRDSAPTHHQQLLKVMHLTDGGEFAAALAPSMILSEQAPMYAEAHFQRACCWHGLDDHAKAAQAYVDCLWRCRFHYTAWQGLARCQIMAGQYRGALNSLQRCLQIVPDLESARLQLRALRRRMRRSDV
ncbi:HEAT repeat domain-containing protein [Stieleria tagensis]|uniref:HEAT repeat domain-containing protein n=1 Tax=Stieleria tagensis TaxID=2956795 RepID=UPI00209B108C|nr:HEAT repeat domain-containing protein [Stieleria tagensis]